MSPQLCLSRRTIIVRVDRVLSQPFTVNTVVLQSRLLIYTIFLLSINDLFNTSGPAHSLADDTTVYGSVHYHTLR